MNQLEAAKSSLASADLLLYNLQALNVAAADNKLLHRLVLPTISRAADCRHELSHIVSALEEK